MARKHRPVDTFNVSDSPSQTIDISPRNCGNCLCWQPLLEGADHGQCRRFPPSLATANLCLTGPVCTFPVTKADDHCFEHRPR